MKKAILFSLAILAFILAACDQQGTPRSDKTLNAKQEALMQEANAQVGMPAITHFQERKLMKMVLEERDKENLVCYAYLFSEMTGKLIYIGKCVGYGLPYSTEFTNPSKAIGTVGSGQCTAVVIPQADPNGLFMPPSAEGTWVNLIDPATGKPRVVYIEPRVIVSPFPLKGEPQ
jgi:hypothetical protein